MSATTIAERPHVGLRRDEGSAPPARGRRMLNKVPEITLYFWIIKVLCTTVGETAADFSTPTWASGLAAPATS